MSKKLYLNVRPAPRLYLDTSDAVAKSTTPDLYLKKSESPVLYLDLAKGNPNREPVNGHFMHGGVGKAHGKGQEDLDDYVKDLLDQLPGDNLPADGEKK